MPILKYKTAGQDGDTRMAGWVAGSKVIWEEDEYRPYDLGLTTSLTPARRLPCGNADCLGRWTLPWRKRHRPIFQGQWGCSGRCVLAMVRAAVGRELQGETRQQTTPHHHRVPLGLVMLAQGWITHEQLRKALDAQKESGMGRIGDWLIAECGVESERVTRALSLQWGCPVLTTDGFSAQSMALMIPRLFVEEFGLLPLRIAGSRILYLGFEDRLDASAALAIEQMTQLKAESGLVNGAQFSTARNNLLECSGLAVKQEALADADLLSARITAILEQKQPVASRLVRFHGYHWLRLWLENGTGGRVEHLTTTAEDVLDYVFTIGARA